MYNAGCEYSFFKNKVRKPSSEGFFVCGVWCIMVAYLMLSIGEPSSEGYFYGADMIDIRKGDCLELLKTMPDHSIDMVLTDPPYGNTSQSWDKHLNWSVIWPELRRVCKVNAAKLFFAVNAFTIDLCASNRKEYRYRIVWRKTMPTNVFNANRMPLRQYEEICVFYQRQPTYNPQMGTGPAYNKKPTISRQSIWGSVSPKWVDGATIQELEKAGITLDENERYHHISIKKGATNITTRYPTDLVDFKPVHNFCKQRLHPNQKPVELLEYLIKTYTNEGETVLDLTMGSGSTGVAAHQCGRHFIGFESDDSIFTIAANRLESLNDAGEAV